MKYTAENFDYLLRLAKASMQAGFAHGAPLHASARHAGHPYTAPAGAYVGVTVATLNRGCMGLQASDLSLFDTVRISAYRALFKDDRFFPPHEGILHTGLVQVHVFTSRSREIRNGSVQECADQLRGDDTIVVSAGPRRALLLACMQDEYHTRSAFVEAAISKAKINPHTYFGNIRVEAFRTESSLATPIENLKEFNHAWY